MSVFAVHCIAPAVDFPEFNHAEAVFEDVIDPFFIGNFIADDYLVVAIYEADFVVGSKDGPQALGELPGFAVLGRDNDFAGVDVEVAALTVLVAEDGEAVALGRARYPAEFFGGVPGFFFVPDAHSVIVVCFHLDICRQGGIVPVVAAIAFFVPGLGDEDTDAEDGEADDSQAHLPGGVEDGFEGGCHNDVALCFAL